MDCDGCERRVKNAVTNMKGYIVKLAACVSVCVYLYFYWSFVLSPVLQFCDISLIRQATMKERYIEAFIRRKKEKEKVHAWNPQISKTETNEFVVSWDPS